MVPLLSRPKSAEDINATRSLVMKRLMGKIKVLAYIFSSFSRLDVGLMKELFPIVNGLASKD